MLALDASSATLLAFTTVPTGCGGAPAWLGDAWRAMLVDPGLVPPAGLEPAT